MNASCIAGGSGNHRKEVVDGRGIGPLPAQAPETGRGTKRRPQGRDGYNRPCRSTQWIDGGGRGLGSDWLYLHHPQSIYLRNNTLQGIYSSYGSSADNSHGLPLRAVQPRMGTTRFRFGTSCVPEVQESVLESSAQADDDDIRGLPRLDSANPARWPTSHLDRDSDGDKAATVVPEQSVGAATRAGHRP